MQNIKSASHCLSLFFRFLCWMFPIAVFYMMYFHINMLMMSILNATQSSLSNGSVKFLSLSQFTYTHQCAILAIQAIPIGITVFIFHQLSKLFRLYEQGYLFEEENIRLIRSISVFMIIGELIQLIYQPMMTLALTMNNPVGERFISISIGTSNVSTLMTGIIIFVASWIVKEAQQLKSDAQLTI